MQRLLVVVALALALGGCVGPPPPPLKAYSGPDQSDAQLAIVHLPDYLRDPRAGDYIINPCKPTGTDIWGRSLSCVDSIKQDDHVYYDKNRDVTNVVKLQPGEYLITYGPVPHGLLEEWMETSRVNLKAGHRYAIKAEECGWSAFALFRCGGLYDVGSWIEDSTTGEVVDRKKPSWAE